MLEYDNSAFYYFCITILSIYIVPSSYYSFKRIRECLNPKIDGIQFRTTVEREKSEKLLSEKRGIEKAFTTLFTINFVFLIIAILSVIYILTLISGDSDIAQFNPFDILGIDVDATDKEIKKAYRGLSLQYHPDKNQGNPAAEQMFMMVAKAYEALTDAVAKENYQKYGNPDGKQALEVSIGLPTFLLDEEYQNMFLTFYLVLFIVIFPICMYLFYSWSKQFGEKSVKYNTYGLFHKNMTDNISPKKFPEMLVFTEEMRTFCASTFDEETEKEVDDIFWKLSKDGYVKKIEKGTAVIPEVKRAAVLVWCHLLRLETKSTTIQEQSRESIPLLLQLTDAMIEVSIGSRLSEACYNLVLFKQCLIQV